jgi:NAD(P)-dependent dehydrogenase (short-subunit alcohol dehydrogenase family)
MKIQDKVWVVTGGGNGIGRELTLQLLQRGAKAVAILDLDRKGMDETVALSTQSEKITTHVVDISNRSDVEQVVKDVIKAHGVVDGLINNAGTQCGRKFGSFAHDDNIRDLNVKLL